LRRLLALLDTLTATMGTPFGSEGLAAAIIGGFDVG